MSHYTLEHIRAAGCRAGLAVNPSTPLGGLRRVDRRPGALHDRQPGLGRPGVHPPSLDKIARLRALLGDDADLEVDGGIDAETAGPCAEAGATLFVAGTAIFGAPDPAGAYAELAATIGCS